MKYIVTSLELRNDLPLLIVQLNIFYHVFITVTDLYIGRLFLLRDSLMFGVFLRQKAIKNIHRLCFDVGAMTNAG